MLEAIGDGRGADEAGFAAPTFSRAAAADRRAIRIGSDGRIDLYRFEGDIRGGLLWGGRDGIA
jgi:hypothetical protein